MFETFRQARNCLAHRRGIVAERDVNSDDENFKLRWCSMGAFLENSDGKERLLDNDALKAGNATIDAGGLIAIRLHWKELRFSVGSQIKLSRHDLSEICFGVFLATNHVIRKIHEFALANGIPDRNLSDAAEAMADLPSIVETPDTSRLNC